VRIRDQATEGEEGVNLMPLIDMVFLLLIFFLVATTMAQEEREINVQLPAISDVVPLSAPPPQMIINIRADGTPVIARKTYTWQQLADLLARISRDEPNRKVLIRADKKSLHHYYASVVGLCIKVGISEARIGYYATPDELSP